jgi:predicted nucleic acid-binding protein
VDAALWALPDQALDVVHAVWEEVQLHAPEALQDPRMRHIVQPVTVPVAVSQHNLDRGEMAALAYALSRQESEEVVVLCDEREARRVCTNLSIRVIGSVGLIVEACRTGRVSAAVAAAIVKDLPEWGRLHVRPQLIERALATLDTL